MTCLYVSSAMQVPEYVNPFKTSSYETLAPMIVGLADDVDKDRAGMLFNGVLSALYFLNDKRGTVLDVAGIQLHLDLDRIMGLCSESEHPDMPLEIRERVLAYLTSLPGFDLSLRSRQPQSTLDAHAELETVYGRVLASLQNTYSYIFELSSV